MVKIGFGKRSYPDTCNNLEPKRTKPNVEQDDADEFDIDIEAFLSNIANIDVEMLE